MPNEKTEPRATWTSREAYLLALVCLTAGLLVGYLLHGSSPGLGPVVGPTPGVTPAASGAGMPLSGAPAVAGAAATAASLQPQAAPLLAALKADPKNVETLVQLGNLYYDNRVYPEAIEYYNRALDVRPNDINVVGLPMLNIEALPTGNQPQDALFRSACGPQPGRNR